MNDSNYRQYPQASRRSYEPRRFESLVAELGREAEERRTRADNQTPHEAPLVRVTKWLVVATVVLAVAGFLGFGAAILQWTTLRSADKKTGETVNALQEQASSMKGQLDTMQQEFTATQRPWISIDSIKPAAPLVFFNDGGLTTSLTFVLSNSGRTPALHVFPYVNPVVMRTREFSEIILKTKEFCEKVRKAPLSQSEVGELGIIAPPNKSFTFPGPLVLKIESDNISKGKFVVRGREAIDTWIGGCVGYGFTFGERQQHQTGFIYQLLGPETFIFMDNKRGISSDKLRFVEMLGGWAD